MACLLVPAAEAIVVTAAYVAIKKKEQKIEAPKLSEGKTIGTEDVKITWSKKLSWLLGMLWGGVLLLALEHFWHGEIVPFAPFLSAMSSPEDTAEMLREMAPVGVSMAVAVTAVWGAMCAAADMKVKQIKAKLKNQTV